MATVNTIELPIVARQNKNDKSSSFERYYFEADTSKTLTTRGLIKHMVDHGLSYPRYIIEGVMGAIVQCLPELLRQGVPVKIDGLGTFTVTVENEKGGCPPAVMKQGGVNPTDYIKGVHIRFIPEGTKLDNITRAAMADSCTFTFGGIAESTTVVQQDGKKVKGTIITPYDVWVAQQNQGE